MWGILSILGMIGVSVGDKIDRYNQAKRNGFATPRANRELQWQYFEQYVTYADCVTPEEYNQIKEETIAEFSNLEHPEILNGMLAFLETRRIKYIPRITKDSRMIAPPALIRKELAYFRLTAYERYLLAKSRFEALGYTWVEAFDRYLPYNCPYEMVKRNKERTIANYNYNHRRKLF